MTTERNSGRVVDSSWFIKKKKCLKNNIFAADVHSTLNLRKFSSVNNVYHIVHIEHTYVEKKESATEHWNETEKSERAYKRIEEKKCYLKRIM